MFNVYVSHVHTFLRDFYFKTRVMYEHDGTYLFYCVLFFNKAALIK